jgi:tetratricopeptide (TPR) repeat protein
MVVLKPGQLPLMVERNDVEKSLALLEKYASAPALLAWYGAATRRWPDSLVLLIGLGNAAYAMGHLEDAEQAFRAAAERHPYHAVALNNLATVLQQRGHLHEALATAERAVALGGEWVDVTQATRNAIRVLLSESGSSTTALPAVN